MSAPRIRSVALTGVLALATVHGARAQCTTSWFPGAGLPGVNSVVQAATTWDPDGPGPQGERIVYGGEFTMAGDVFANRIAAFDPVTGAWSAFGAGMNARVTSVLGLPNGELVAGGVFTTAGGASALHVARWSNGAWSPLGAGVRSASQPFLEIEVRAFVRLANGDLVCGGNFDTAGSVPANRIARWNGTAWWPLGSGIAAGGNGVNAIAVMNNGELAVGGSFPSAGGVAAPNLARWNGSVWLPIGASPNGEVFALGVLSGGELIAAGGFSAIGGTNAPWIARWNGTAWSALGSTINATVLALRVLPNDEIWAGGFFRVGAQYSSVARWNGSSWLGTYAGGPFGADALAVDPRGELFVGGSFWGATNPPAYHVMRWNGTAWRALGSGVATSARVRALVALPGGDLVATGDFTMIAGVPANHIARYDGSRWHALGAGLNRSGHAVIALRNGDIVAAGDFFVAGSVIASRIARWNGTNWVALGGGFDGRVLALAELPSGDIVAGGAFVNSSATVVNRIARWDGTAWRALGTGMDADVMAVAALGSGDIVAGGIFQYAGGVAAASMARWNGAAWRAFGRPLAVPMPVVDSLLVTRNGDLVAGGRFDTIGGLLVNNANVARFDGRSWRPLGGGLWLQPYWLAELPDGDLVASYWTRLQRFNGSSWSDSGQLMDPGEFIETFAFSTRDGLFAGGTFTYILGLPSSFIARYATSCPASATAVPSSCIGPAGPLVLGADAFPYLGASYRSTSRGHAPNSVAASFIGLTSPALPLAALHPVGLPGCDLLASAELVLPVTMNVSGTGSISLTLPELPVLVGLVLFEQHLQLELDAAGNALSLSGSNGLRLVIGSF